MEGFEPKDKLYRYFHLDQLDQDGTYGIQVFAIPDMSCNWDRFSDPEDVFLLPQSKDTGGCFAVSVEDARFGGKFGVVHDPVCDDVSQSDNYAHTEVRMLNEADIEALEAHTPIDPRRKYKSKSKQKKLEWRTHMSEKVKIVIPLKAD